MTLVVVGVEPAGVVGVVLNRLDVTYEISTRVHGVERPQLAVDRPGRILELVLGVGVVEERDGLGWQWIAIRALRHRIKHAFGIHVLVALSDQSAPIIIDLPQGRGTHAFVSHRVDRTARNIGIVDRGGAGWYLTRH